MRRTAQLQKAVECIEQKYNNGDADLISKYIFRSDNAKYKGTYCLHSGTAQLETDLVPASPLPASPDGADSRQFWAELMSEKERCWASFPRSMY